MVLISKSHYTESLAEGYSYKIIKNLNTQYFFFLVQKKIYLFFVLNSFDVFHWNTF